MIKIKWTVEEAVALFDLYFKHENYNDITIDEIEALSEVLNNRAKVLSLSVDEKYRNSHGLRMQLAGIHYIVTDGKEGIRNVGNTFKQVYLLYTILPTVFQQILKEFYSNYDNHNL